MVAVMYHDVVLMVGRCSGVLVYGCLMIVRLTGLQEEVVLNRTALSALSIVSTVTGGHAPTKQWIFL